MQTYDPNTTLRIREHLPPEPFDGIYEYEGFRPRPWVDWSNWISDHCEPSRLEFALAHPPLETESPGTDERLLTITGTKTRHRGGGAHVVTCFLDGDPSVEYVAKIYDGADYPLKAREGVLYDCMTRADLDYSIEAWAYRTMQPIIGGTVVPGYFGSWTFVAADGDNNTGQQRWVRLILLELVPGECMLDMIRRAESEDGQCVDYAKLPPEPFRLRVLQNIIEAKHLIWWEAEVVHEDVAPRNVIVKPDGSVVLIDFNQAYIYALTAAPDSHPRKQNPTALPRSPIEEWWGSANLASMQKRGFLAHWVPESWLREPDLAAEWVVDIYRDSPRFQPLSKWWLDRECQRWGSERILRLLESLGGTRPGPDHVPWDSL